MHDYCIDSTRPCSTYETTGGLYSARPVGHKAQMAAMSDNWPENSIYRKGGNNEQTRAVATRGSDGVEKGRQRSAVISKRQEMEGILARKIVLYQGT